MQPTIHLRRTRPNPVRYSWRIFSLLTALALLLNVKTSVAEPIIKNFDVISGELTFAEVSGALSYRVEWSATMAPGSWSREAPGVALIQPIGSGDRTVKIGIIPPPCFYRVVAVLESLEPPAPVGFALIPAGPFQMGNTFWEEEGVEQLVRTVNVSAFLIGEKEVTKAEWDEVRAGGISRGYTDLPVGLSKASDHPVTEVSWFDVIKWCNARSEKDGLSPVYMVDGAVMRTGETEPTVNWEAGGYRLPTEAEWEKAARGGLSGKRFPWGDTISHSQANYYSLDTYAYDVSPTRGFHPDYDSNDFDYPRTSPVGSFAPNGYVLYDMAGNAWEWCSDWYSPYELGPQTDPQGPITRWFGLGRVLRGGSWKTEAIASLVATRYSSDPSNRRSSNGFRLARKL
jgi:formylglycine-generating enzyme required for sulfatase activity